ncbi:MAG: class I SAM-dependent methyltransferase [Pseudomonadota bacterium]
MKRFFTAALERMIAFVVRKGVPYAREATHGIYADRWHPHHALREAALADTVAYISEAMPDAMIMADEFEVLTHAVKHAPAEGMVLEFGVRTGTTINHLAERLPGRALHGFDSFEGLPEDWTGWTQRQGSFGGEGLPPVAANVTLVRGWFDASLPAFLEENAGEVALIHIDSDLYSSAKTVLDALAPRFRPGSIIVFNEYFNYPNWRAHEFRALQEFRSTHDVRYTYLCWGKFEVAVRIDAIGSSGG